MGFFRKDDGRGIERQFIELDDAAKHEVVVKWPDQQIRRGTRVTVDLDFVAVFTSLGKVIDVLGPGQHVLEEGPSPLTAWLIDHLTADRYYDTELFFVNTHERVNNRFGGPVDTLSAADSGLVVTLRVFGQHAFKVTDPVTFLTRLHGSGAASSTATVVEWVSSQVMAALREELPALIADHGVLALGALQDTTEVTTREKANRTLADYGVQVTQFGELNLSVTDEDAAQVKELARREKYAELAGGYDKFALSEAFLNRGGSGGSTGPDLLLLNALMSGGLLTHQQPSPPAMPTVQDDGQATVGGRDCVRCDAQVSASAAFCAACGVSLTCHDCGSGLHRPGRFCGTCGTAQTPPVSA